MHKLTGQFLSVVITVTISFGEFSLNSPFLEQTVVPNAKVSSHFRPDSLPYIGQPRPDTIPLRFGPPYLISNGVWTWHGSPKFSPDGKEMFFVKYHHNLTSGEAKMYVMTDFNGQWTSPASPEFASDSIDNSPVYLQNGNTLYFSSSRSGSMRYYYVSRATGDWSQPQLINMAYSSLPGPLGWDFTVTRDSTIYFALYNPVDGIDIYRSHSINGLYSQFEKLPSQINTSYQESSPYIDPDEKYILFSSNRPGGYGLHDIYISFRKNDGSWTPAQNMGNRINGSHEEAFPWVTFDGKYMFFNSLKTGDQGYNAYWVDSKVIDRLNPLIGIRRIGESIPKEIQLFQNYPNPFNPSTKIKFSIPLAGKDRSARDVQSVRLVIYDILGHKAAVLVNTQVRPGTYEAAFDVSDQIGQYPASGIYFYRLETDDVTLTKKMIFLK